MAAATVAGPVRRFVGHDIMNLTSALTSLKAGEAASQIQMAVAARMLETQRDQGDAAVKLIEAAADTMAQAASWSADIGASLDVTA